MVYNETPLVPSNLSDPNSSGTQENAPSTSQAASGETANNLQNSQSSLNTQSPPLAPQLNTNHISRSRREAFSISKAKTPKLYAMNRREET